MLESFRVAKFRFTVYARKQIRLPDYKGAVFRGGFGYAFKKVVCVVKGKPCDEYLIGNAIDYLPYFIYTLCHANCHSATNQTNAPPHKPA